MNQGGQIGLRSLKPGAYTSGGNNGIGYQGGLREIPSRREDSEFYASSSEDEELKRYESNDRHPEAEKKLRKLKEKADNPGAGSISISNMQKLTQKLPQDGSMFEKSLSSHKED